MLREIVNFVDTLSPENFEFNLTPKEGIHCTVRLNEEGGLDTCQAEYYNKKDVSDFLLECLRKQQHTLAVSSNKMIDSGKKIHSCSPFCVAFKWENEKVIPKMITSYLDNAKKYLVTEEQKHLANIFYHFCTSGTFNDFITKTVSNIQEIYGKKGKSVLSSKNYFYLYLENVDIDDYLTTYQKYLDEKVFNTDEHNQQVEDTLYGVPDFMTGYNTKKPFLQHVSCPFLINLRVPLEHAKQLFYFKQMIMNRQIPNPLPLFIDKKELGKMVMSFFQEKRIGYQEIIKELYSTSHRTDLGNYYLLYFNKGEVCDFDYVSSFQYETKIHIEKIFSKKSYFPEYIDNIFDFEKHIVKCIFNNQLVKQQKDGSLKYCYFEEIKNKPQFIRATTYQLVTTYRKSFFDYIYKSRTSAITFSSFYNIMCKSIIDDVRNPNIENTRKRDTVCQKLDIWFNLYFYFGSNEGETRNMVHAIKNIQENIRKILRNEAKISNDEEFAYASGQLINYLLYQSEVANKTHALLEPFLQKSNCNHFKIAITQNINRYKHKLRFHHVSFNRLCSQVLGYQTEQSLQSLQPMILAGYFADNVLFEKNTQNLEGKNNDGV